MTRPRVAFLCTGNSCRSQMAEGLLRAMAGDRMAASSAGTYPSRIHPLTVQVMREIGIDISRQYPKGIAAVEPVKAALVVTLCTDADENCPVLPPHVRREHWPVTDPAMAAGTPSVVLDVFRQIRDELRAHVRDLLAREGIPAVEPTPPARAQGGGGR